MTCMSPRMTTGTPHSDKNINLINQQITQRLNKVHEISTSGPISTTLHH